MLVQLSLELNLGKLNVAILTKYNLIDIFGMKHVSPQNRTDIPAWYAKNSHKKDASGP